jgi:hypothetical protein
MEATSVLICRALAPNAFAVGKGRCLPLTAASELVDTLGLLLHAIIHPANVQDRDGGILLQSTPSGICPFLKKLFADGGYLSGK